MSVTVNEKYNNLTAISKVEGRYWLFECECGTLKKILGYHVASGATKSCGCYHKQKVSSHQQCKTKEYVAWVNMKRRVKSPNQRQSTYAVRGLSYPPEWEVYENFIRDVGKMPDHIHRWSLERINNDLSYSKDNCKWALPIEQAHNRCMPSTNTSGHTGVSYRLEEGKYLVVRARITCDGVEFCKRFPVSRYSSLDEAIRLAVDWRTAKLAELGFAETYGAPLPR